VTVWHRALPVLAIVTFILTTGAILASAGDVLGYDYRAYAAAAQRLLDGQPLYDATVDVAGPFAIYLYPPPFALAFVPFAMLPDPLGVWAWTGACVAMVLGAIALMPVGRDVRWGVLLLAAIDWPVLYSIKLGQVGPLLLLLFAAGWRWLDRPDRLGVTIGLGVLVKLQPGLLVVWALLAGRTRAAGVAVALVAVVAIASLLVVGTGAWLDYPGLLGRVNEPVTTPHNMTLGAVLYRAGWSLDLASLAQLGWTLAMLGLALLASWRRAADASYLVVVVATQALSPLLWDHYAIVLLLPVAWLLDRGRWWAVVFVLATPVLLVDLIPALIYPAAFWTCLVAVVATGIREVSGVPGGAPVAQRAR
jgi:alpha-1,2-mannosyltransferase